MPSNRWGAGDWINEGAQLLRHDPALGQRLISQGLRVDPGISVGWFNLGLGLHQRGRINAAIRAYQLALNLEHPATESIQANLSQDLLLKGRFQEGWHHYEQRLNNRSKHDHSYFEAMAGPSWTGPNDARPFEHLVLVAEQGFGDTLQFLRLALALRDQGLAITLFCQRALVPLLAEGCQGIAVCSEVPASQFSAGTRWCPLMSLPHRLNLCGHNIPLSQGYLKAAPQRITQWAKALPRRNGIRRIALHWQGNPNHEGKIYSLGRSVPFQALTPLASITNAEFILVQKGEGLKQVYGGSGFPLAPHQEPFIASMDFRDTAAVLKSCDLLISSDSGVVHLAGALGVPTWVALRWIPEWRWGLGSASTPWYSSVRLFRQPRQGDWASVVQAMVDALKCR